MHAHTPDPTTGADIAAGLHTLTPYRQRMREMFRNRAWLAQNVQSLCQQYAEQWVVIDDQSVKGAGDSPQAALADSGPVDETVALVLMLSGRIPTPL
jgi:hypothetical protein